MLYSGPVQVSFILRFLLDCCALKRFLRRIVALVRGEERTAHYYPSGVHPNLKRASAYSALLLFFTRRLADVVAFDFLTASNLIAQNFNLLFSSGSHKARQAPPDR
jgi:hypothetical protein